jgi:hypothetical protein
MSMGCDYVSELQPPTGILFAPQVIYGHGESWWNDVDGENSWLVHHSSLTILTAESPGSKEEEWAKRMINLASRSSCVRTCKWFCTCRKIFRHEADGFTSPSKEGVLRIFTALKNPSFRPGLNLRTLGSNGKHANHYTSRRLLAYNRQY